MADAHYEPPGPTFWDIKSGRWMKLVLDAGNDFDEWICYRHPDGQWMSLRKATTDDLLRVAHAMTKA